MEETISLNKFISDTGYCSRREADNLIKEGRVLLNDRPAAPGNRYTPGDVVEVDGSLITPDSKGKRVYLALNKPAGITSTTEEHVKGNIISFVGYPKRIFPIGRLDKDSEGLIFLTNDGDIINKILRAGNSHEKEYIVRVNKPVDLHFVQRMSGGLPIMGTTTLPCKVHMINRQTFRIILTQGLNRQIRRMCEFLGYTVMGLQRVRIMNIKLGNLPLGKWRNLSEAEVLMLKEAVADSKATAKAEKPSRKKTKPFSGGDQGKHTRKEQQADTNGKAHTKPSYNKELQTGFNGKAHTKSAYNKEKPSPGNKPKFDKSKPAHKKDKPGFKEKPGAKEKRGPKEKRGGFNHKTSGHKKQGNTKGRSRGR